MTQLRISKYNLKYRDENGFYNKEEWTEYNQLDAFFTSKETGYQEYLRIEERYVSAVFAFFFENNCFKINLTNKEFRDCKDILLKKENYFLNGIYDKVKIKSTIEFADLKEVLQLILRGFFWAELNCDEKQLMVEFGYDFYMYFNAPEFSDKIISKIKEIGLHIG